MDVIDILIKNTTIMTMNPDFEIVKDGYVAIKDGRIVDIGASDDGDADHQPGEIIDAEGNPTLPGFVNTHHHFYSTYFRGSPYLYGEGDLHDFLRNTYSPSLINANKQDCYYGTLSGCVEMIKSGITSVIDVNGWNSLHATEAVLEAFNDVGIRGTEARLLVDRDLWDIRVPRSEDIWNAVDETIELIERWQENDRLRVWFHPTMPAQCSDDLLKRIGEICQELDVGMSIHLHEEKMEVDGWVELTGVTPIQYYNKDGFNILNRRNIATHCIWVDDEDIAILHKTGTPVSHNPVINLISGGIAPVPSMLEAGVTVGLGTDDGFGDMFETMKTAALIHKVPAGDTNVISAEKILEMATIDGAKVMGLEQEVGSIEVGKKADLIILDLKKPNTTPTSEPLSYLIVYCGKAENVDTAIIDGKIVMRHRKMETIDEAEVIEKTQQAMGRIDKVS